MRFLKRIRKRIRSNKQRLDDHEKRIQELQDMVTTLANGMTVDPVVESALEIQECGVTLAGPTAVFTINGSELVDDPDGTRVYDVGWSVDGVNYTVTPHHQFTSLPATFSALSVPTDGQSLFIRLRTAPNLNSPWDPDLHNCSVTAYTDTGAGGGGGTVGLNNPQFTEVKSALDDALDLLVNNGYSSDNSCSNPNNASLLTADSGYPNILAFAGLRRAWLVTQDITYLQRMMDMANRFIDDGLDIDGDGYLDWWSCAGGGYNHHHYEWRAAAGLGILLNLLLDASTPSSVATTANKNKLGEFLRDHVWSKWFFPNSPTGQSSSDGSNATHMLARLIPVVIALEKFYGGTAPQTSGQSYNNWLVSGPCSLLEDHVLHPANNTNGACNIRGRYQPVPGADVGGSPTPGTNDVSHGMDVVIGLLMAADEGFLDNPAAVRSCLCNALHNVIWNGTTFNHHVDGSGPEAQFRAMGSWFLLLEHCPQNISQYTAWTLANSSSGSINFALRICSYAALL